VLLGLGGAERFFGLVDPGGEIGQLLSWSGRARLKWRNPLEELQIFSRGFDGGVEFDVAFDVGADVHEVFDLSVEGEEAEDLS